MSAVNSILNLLRFNRKNWKAVVLCLVAATVFWFFNALNKTYTTQLAFPVEIQYDRENFVPVSALPTEVKMNVTGLGWTLIRRTAGVKVPTLVLPLERPTEVKKVVGSTLPALLGNQITDLQINFVATDTLHINLQPLAGRWIALTVQETALLLRDGFGLASTISFSPDSVFVQGPRSVVESLPNPYPLPLPWKGVDDNIDTAVPVLISGNSLTVEPAKTSVSFRVEPIKEWFDSVAVEVQVPLRYQSKLAVNVKQVHYTLQIPESIWPTAYDRKAIKATLSVPNPTPGKTRMAPTLSGLPDFCRVVSIDSVEVSFR
jgi:hypothetical protein